MRNVSALSKINKLKRNQVLACVNVVSKYGFVKIEIE